MSYLESRRPLGRQPGIVRSGRTLLRRRTGGHHRYKRPQVSCRYSIVLLILLLKHMISRAFPILRTPEVVGFVSFCPGWQNHVVSPWPGRVYPRSQGANLVSFCPSWQNHMVYSLVGCTRGVRFCKFFWSRWAKP